MSKIVGLLPKTTGLPFVVWMHHHNDREIRRIEITPSQDHETNRTLYRLDHFRRVCGPYHWTEMALLGQFVRINDRVIIKFWNGEIDDGRTAVSLIKRLDDDLVAGFKSQGEHIEQWRLACEAMLQAGGKVDYGYMSLRNPPPDHPEPP